MYFLNQPANNSIDFNLKVIALSHSQLYSIGSKQG